jgi:hypothetical protein
MTHMQSAKAIKTRRSGGQPAKQILARTHAVVLRAEARADDIAKAGSSRSTREELEKQKLARSSGEQLEKPKLARSSGEQLEKQKHA